MNMQIIENDSSSEQISNLFSAELQFRLACAVRLAVTMEEQPLDLPMEWSFGKHNVKYKEIAIRSDQADFAAWSLRQSTMYLMAVAIKDAIEAVIPNPYNHKDQNIRNAYQIARLIRNAFAHGPFKPMWLIDKKCRNKVFEVKDIIKLDTRGLDRTTFDWRHYGGPLAILRFCQFVRYDILKDKNRRPEERDLPDPKNKYIQQGGLILKQMNAIPAGAKKVKLKRKSDGGVDVGEGHIIYGNGDFYTKG
jgi:hypothetical protein